MNRKSFTKAKIDLNALAQNYRVVRKLAGRGTRMLAVVKADAYGHGMVPVAKKLNKLGVDVFGVGDVEEGIELRKAGIRRPILILESILKIRLKDVFQYRLTPTVCTVDLAAELNRLARRKGKKLGIHVKVDTGMGRLGVWHKEAEQFIDKLNKFDRISIEGLYTHFPVADTDPKFTKKQITQLATLYRHLVKQRIPIPNLHYSNSMGMAGYKSNLANLVRPGLMLYGLYPRPSLKKKIKLKPVMTVESKITFLKRIEKGRSISYGRTFISKKNMAVATVPIGYSDGYFRMLSNKSYVLVGGVRCQVLGRVTMDQIVIDVSKVKNARVGSPVVVLGKQGKAQITADELAALTHTINYEIICALGTRLPKVFSG